MKIKALDGLPILDAKRAISISVSKRDVGNAERKEPAHCAVALACRRELHAKEVRVHLSRVYVRLGTSSWLRYVTPAALRMEIVAFDRGGEFLEGEFTIPAPSPAKRKRGRQGSAKAGKSGRKRRAPRVLTDVRGGPA